MGRKIEYRAARATGSTRFRLNVLCRVVLPVAVLLCASLRVSIAAEITADWHAVRQSSPVSVGRILDYLNGFGRKSNDRVLSGQFAGYASGCCADSDASGNCRRRIAFSECFERSIARLADSGEAGKWVAIAGADYGFSSPDQQREANRVLINWWNAGGLVALSWHAGAPWDCAVKKEKSRLGPSQIRDEFNRLVDHLSPSGSFDPNHSYADEWLAQLERIASRLVELKAAGVIVFWRPFHEMNGDWFWWGNQNPVLFRGLWRHMYRMFTAPPYRLTNLIWVYAPNDHPVYNHEFYPGSDYVDVIGLDAYGTPLRLNSYRQLLELDLKKPLGLSEYGRGGADPNDSPGEFVNPDLISRIRRLYPALVFFHVWHAPWSLRSNPGAIDLLNDPWVITRDELPDFNQP